MKAKASENGLSVELDIKLLRALCAFQCVDETRSYLNQILVSGELLVATNGHCLAGIRIPGSKLPERKVGVRGLPDIAKSCSARAGAPPLTLNGASSYLVWSCGEKRGTLEWGESFSPWRHVIPHSRLFPRFWWPKIQSGAQADPAPYFGLDAKYLAWINNLQQAAGGHYTAFSCGAELDPVCFAIDPPDHDFHVFGVIMPCRLG